MKKESHSENIAGTWVKGLFLNVIENKVQQLIVVLMVVLPVLFVSFLFDTLIEWINSNTYIVQSIVPVQNNETEGNTITQFYKDSQNIDLFDGKLQTNNGCTHNAGKIDASKGINTLITFSINSAKKNTVIKFNTQKKNTASFVLLNKGNQPHICISQERNQVVFGNLDNWLDGHSKTISIFYTGLLNDFTIIGFEEGESVEFKERSANMEQMLLIFILTILLLVLLLGLRLVVVIARLTKARQTLSVLETDFKNDLHCFKKELNKRSSLHAENLQEVMKEIISLTNKVDDYNYKRDEIFENKFDIDSYKGEAVGVADMHDKKISRLKSAKTSIFEKIVSAYKES